MRLLASVILALAMTGCGTFAMQYHYRLYSGPLLPPEKVAVLKGSFPLVLLRVDEKPGKNNISTALSTQFKAYNTFGNFSGSPGNFRIELLPGKHKLECGYGREAFVNAKLASTMRVFDFEAEAGKTYEVRATPSIASEDIDGYAVEVVTYGDRQSEGTRVSCSTPEIKPIPFLVPARIHHDAVTVFIFVPRSP